MTNRHTCKGPLCKEDPATLKADHNGRVDLIMSNWSRLSLPDGQKAYFCPKCTREVVERVFE